MKHAHYYVAIMAGGIGSRFWPKSRTAYPKQFLDILNTGKSLLQWTYQRYASFIPEENIFVVTSEEYVGLVADQLPNMMGDNILAEPSRKNTAPCVAYISFKLQQRDPEACLIVAPSDHLILDEQQFMHTTLQALQFVESVRSLVTLGITPTHPNIGYGYIQHEPLPVAEGIYKVKNQDLVPLNIAVHNLVKKFTEVVFTFVPREHNRRADEMVNKILDAQAPETNKNHSQ